MGIKLNSNYKKAEVKIWTLIGGFPQHDRSFKMMILKKYMLVLGIALSIYSLGVAEQAHIGICDLSSSLDKFDPEYVRVTQASLQWADVEPQQGVYDFSGLDLSLKQIQEKGRFAIIKLNGNDKPDWLFDQVPYHPDTSWDKSVEDTLGILMYWHPNFVASYTNLLIAYGNYLQTSEYRSLRAIPL